MSEPVRAHLERKLGEAFAVPWGETVLIYRFVERAPDAGTSDGLSAVVRFFVRGGTGGDREIHAAELSGVTTPAEADDWLAEVLSTMLAGHPDWSRN